MAFQCIAPDQQEILAELKRCYDADKTKIKLVDTDFVVVEHRYHAVPFQVAVIEQKDKKMLLDQTADQGRSRREFVAEVVGEYGNEHHYLKC
jgi:hypothetical protein